MHDAAAVPSWHQQTDRPTSDLKSSRTVDFDTHPQYSGPWDSFPSYSPAWQVSGSGWVSSFPHLYDGLDVNSPHALEPFAFQSPQTSASRLQYRLPTPEYNDHNEYLPLLGPSPTPKAKRDPDLTWLASPSQYIADEPVVHIPDSLTPDYSGHSQHVSPIDHDDSSEATEHSHSPLSFPRYSSPVLADLAPSGGGVQQIGQPPSSFGHTSTGDESLNHGPATGDWLTLLSPESYDEPPSIIGMLPDIQAKPEPTFLQFSARGSHMSYGPHGGLAPNAHSTTRKVDSQYLDRRDGSDGAPAQGTGTQESVSAHGLPGVSSKLNTTSLESSIASGGSGNQISTGAQPPSSLDASPLSSLSMSPIDSSPRQAATHSRNSSTASSRKRKEKGNVSKAEKPSKTFLPLHIVQEDGLGGSVPHSARIPVPARARRNGPLSVDGRRDAALRRKDRSVCVWCRLAKKKCSGQDPCATCIEQTKTAMFEQPCVKADFFQIVESGTCNYISQRAVNHMTLDGSTRVRMELPASFEMKQLLSLLDERRGKFNIRARQSWGPLYVLDIDETYRFLEEVSGSGSSSHYDLGDFIDHRVLKCNKWMNCIKDANPMDEIFSLLSQWNNMPSRASYDFIPVTDNTDDGDLPSQPMDVNDPSHRREILLAAQLSRIVCRKLEVDGYRALQHALNKNKWDDTPYESFVQFVSQLGHILLSLRWRVSWWGLLGDGGAQVESDAIARERYEDRVSSLCRILYFYYTSVKLKLPSWTSPSNLDGVWSTYADAAPVWDDFPSAATMEGFENWMARGRDLIHEAGVKSRIAKF